MIRNKGYTGYLINGNVEKECPELRIIEPEVFEKAQELRDARRREKGEDADSYSPHALLCGKVFCAHCGNRLNITSSGRTRLRADGTVVKEKRYRYSCNLDVYKRQKMRFYRNFRGWYKACRDIHAEGRCDRFCPCGRRLHPSLC